MCGVFQKLRTQFSLALIVSTLAWSSTGSAAGLLRPADERLPALEIRSHEVQVVIEDGYAVTQVEQVFSNPNGQDLEAIYSFPVPKAGSVAEFTVWIDGQPVTGEVLEKKEARKIYEEEKQAGRDAGLTEKDEYRTFDVHVSPVRAGQDARIRLVYLQPAEVGTGIGRYVYPLEEGGVDEQRLKFWRANNKVQEKFSFDLQLKSAYPVDAVRMPNKAPAITQVSPGEQAAKVRLDPIFFEPATVAILEKDQEYLAKIASILEERPEMHIKVCGRAVEADRNALYAQAQQKLAAEAKAEAAKDKATKGKAATIPTPNPISDEQLSALAAQRATVIEQYMVDSHGIKGNRLISCQPQVEKDGQEAKPRTELLL